MEPTIRKNDRMNGIEITFPQEPEDDVKIYIRSKGFRWSKYKKLWWKSYREGLMEEMLAHFSVSIAEPAEKAPNELASPAMKKTARINIYSKETINRRLLREEIKAGKMLVSQYQYFDGMIDGYQRIPDEERKWTDTISDSLERALASSNERAYMWDNGMIHLDDFYIKYKDDIKIPKEFIPKRATEADMYVDLSLKPEFEEFSIDKSQASDADINVGDRVEVELYGRKLCGKVIKKDASRWSIRPMFGEAREEIKYSYEVELDNGYVTHAYQFRLSDECSSLEPAAIFMVDKYKNKRFMMPDWVWQQIHQFIKDRKHAVKRAEGRRNEANKRSDLQAASRYRENAIHHMSHYLGWELNNMEFSRKYITGEGEKEQKVRIDAWQDKLKVQPIAGVVTEELINKLRAEQEKESKKPENLTAPTTLAELVTYYNAQKDDFYKNKAISDFAYRLSGPALVAARQVLLKVLTGQQIPKKQAGIHRIEAELKTYLQKKTAEKDRPSSWIKAGTAIGVIIVKIHDKHPSSTIENLNRQFELGREIEKEHTTDETEALRIAYDHLYEDPEYYTKAKPEKWAEKEIKKEKTASGLLIVIIQGKSYPAQDLEDASLRYRKTIDMLNIGASETPTALVYDGDTRNLIGHIAYNGRIFAGSPAEWTMNTEKLYDPIPQKPSSVKVVTMYYKVYTTSLRSYLDFLHEIRPFVTDGKIFSAGIGEEYLILTGDYDKEAAMHPEVSFEDFDSVISSSKNIRIFNRLQSKPAPERRWNGKWVHINERIEHIEAVLKAEGLGDTDIKTEAEEAADEVRKQIADERAPGAIRPAFMTDLSLFPMLSGREIEISMPNGEKRKGQFVIVELDNIIASHNEENFHSEPLYPKNSAGNNINDRNYKDDPAAQKAVMDYARELEPERLITTSRTPSGTPIITKDGFVVSGNNRAMSLKLAAKNYPENYRAYIEFLSEEIEAYGFPQQTGKAIAGGQRIPVIDSKGPISIDIKFTHPVLVRIDYDFPEYTTQELAKYNKDTKKAERPVDKAIKLSNILRENERCAEIIAETTGQYDTFTDFYANTAAQKKLARALIDCNLLTSQEMPAYFTDTVFTETGKEFIENLLAALVLDREALLSAEVPGVKVLRQRVITALPVLMKNAVLPEGVLVPHINQAFILQQKIRATGSEFNDWIRQQNLFGDKYDRKVIYLNRLLNEGKFIFKNAIESYNQSVLQNQGPSLFGEKPGLDEIFDKFIKGAINPTEQRLIEASDLVQYEGPLGSFAGQVPDDVMRKRFRENEPIRDVFERAGVPYPPEKSLQERLIDYFTITKEQALADEAIAREMAKDYIIIGNKNNTFKYVSAKLKNRLFNATRDFIAKDMVVYAVASNRNISTIEIDNPLKVAGFNLKDASNATIETYGGYIVDGLNGMAVLKDAYEVYQKAVNTAIDFEGEILLKPDMNASPREIEGRPAEIKNHKNLIQFLKSEGIEMLLTPEDDLIKLISDNYSREQLPPASMLFQKDKKSAIEKLIQFSVMIEGKRKEPWEMLLWAFATYKFISYAEAEFKMTSSPLAVFPEQYRAEHRQAIVKALEEGKEVDKNVLADYPKDLMEKIWQKTEKEHKKLYNKQLLRSEDGSVIFLVNGEAVRKEHVEFTMGGHGFVYNWIPQGEIWIDENLSDKPDDLEAVIRHEVFEVRKMRNEGMSYDDAHELANQVEEQQRNKADEKKMDDKKQLPFIAFYKGKVYNLYSDSAYHAQLAAAEYFNAKHSYQVTVKPAAEDPQEKKSDEYIEFLRKLHELDLWQEFEWPIGTVRQYRKFMLPPQRARELMDLGVKEQLIDKTISGKKYIEAIISIPAGDGHTEERIEKIYRDITGIKTVIQPEKSDNAYEFYWRGYYVDEKQYGGTLSKAESIITHVLADIGTLIEDFGDLQGISKADKRIWSSWNELVKDLIERQYTENRQYLHRFDEKHDTYEEGYRDEKAFRIADQIISANNFDEIIPGQFALQKIAKPEAGEIVELSPYTKGKYLGSFSSDNFRYEAVYDDNMVSLKGTNKDTGISDPVIGIYFNDIDTAEISHRLRYRIKSELELSGVRLYKAGDIVSYSSEKYGKTVEGKILEHKEKQGYLVKFNDVIPGLFTKKEQLVAAVMLRLVKRAAQKEKKPQEGYILTKKQQEYLDKMFPWIKKELESGRDWSAIISSAWSGITGPEADAAKEYIDAKIASFPSGAEVASIKASDYKNDFELNKAIESLLDQKWTHDLKDWSADQLEFISHYSGYGGLDEFGQIDKGSLFEFYTPGKVIEKMWGLAYKYGYNEGPIMEPSCGTGLFFKREYVKSHVPKFAVEINKYSARITKLLYPEVNINNGMETMYFEQLFIRNNYTVRDKVTQTWDLVIGNPPYGEAQSLYLGMGEKTYSHAKNYIDYFIFRGLDLLRKDGLLIYIIGAEVASGGVPWLDQGSSKCKEAIAKKGKLIDAYRLPEGMFARTNVVTDIVVFRKR